jgi:RNA polymerase sigma factor (sigma-70 family)
LEQLYRVFSRGLRFFLARQLGAQDFQDTLHETFLVTARAISSGEIRDPERLPGFVRTVAQRQVAAYIERQVHSRRRETDLDSGVYAVDHSQNAEQASILRQKTELMKKTVATLKERDREILVRFYLKEQHPEQICLELNLTETQFRLFKSRAKAAFGERGKAELKKAGSTFPPAATAHREGCLLKTVRSP